MSDKTKRPYVPMPEDELKEIKHEAIEEGEKSGAYMLRMVRIGRAAKILLGKYVFGEYDLEDFFKALKGDTPDIEAIDREISEAGKGLSLREYQEKLREMKNACREGKRIIELREDRIDEKLDELEHLIEELGGETILEKKR